MRAPAGRPRKDVIARRTHRIAHKDEAVSPDGFVQVTCWCEARILLVRVEEFNAGVTGSCGLAECKEVIW